LLLGWKLERFTATIKLIARNLTFGGFFGLSSHCALGEMTWEPSTFEQRRVVAISLENQTLTHLPWFYLSLLMRAAAALNLVDCNTIGKEISYYLCLSVGLLEDKPF
jgi:hypothetical protein